MEAVERRELNLNEDHVASVLAGQTAIIARLCELLFEKEIIARDEVRVALKDLLMFRKVSGSNPAIDHPIEHLLTILESDASHK